MGLRHIWLAALVVTASPASADPLHDRVMAELPSLLTLYADLHRHPELSGQETATAAKLAREARQAGFDVTTGIGGHGLVAVMKNGPGPVVMIRTDMDGLPVVEQTGLPFASSVRGKTRTGQDTGVMHACGHDTHMASWVGTARIMAAMKDRWSGTLVMIGQPSEETGEGAKAMLDGGLFTRFPKPQYALAFHDAAVLPAGVIGLTSGYALANVDSIDLIVKGVGGHGAYPHMTRDPIVLAARIVGTLQTLVSREIDPQEPAVVTVGAFNAGTKYNVIPGEAQLQLTVRSYKPEVRKTLIDGIARIARGEAIAAGVPEDRMPVMTLTNQSTPAAYNTPPLAARMMERFTARFGRERVTETPAVMGGEDFGRYRLADPAIESLIFWVGGVPKDKWDVGKGDISKLPSLQGDITKLPSLHSPFWAPDAKAVIATATEAMSFAATELLAKK
jgi:amidohydrolase